VKNEVYLWYAETARVALQDIMESNVPEKKARTHFEYVAAKVVSIFNLQCDLLAML
jgi:hypothetical protein